MNIDDIVEILNQNSVPAATVKQIVADLKQAEEDNKPDPKSKSKNKFVVVLNSPTNELANAQAWVVQVSEETDAKTVLTKVDEATREFNSSTRKGRKSPVKGFAQAARLVKRKFFKTVGVNIKNKEAAETVVTD